MLPACSSSHLPCSLLYQVNTESVINDIKSFYYCIGYNFVLQQMANFLCSHCNDPRILNPGMATLVCVCVCVCVLCMCLYVLVCVHLC